MYRWHDVDGWDYFWMSAMMILWIVVIGAVVWAIVNYGRRDVGSGPPSPNATAGNAATRSAREELDLRLARGEISEEEYRRKRDLIGAP